MNRKMLALSLGAVLVLAAAVLYGIGHKPVHDKAALPKQLAALAPQNPAKAAPAVAFSDAGGARHALSDYKGKYVLLNLWATWCAPCVAELPALARVSGAVPGLQVLAVNMDKTPVDAVAFLKSHNAGILGSLKDSDVVLMRSFQVVGMPTTVLIDPTGKVVAKAEGPAEWDAPESIEYFKSLTSS